LAYSLRWTGMRTFLATETRVQLHEWLAIGTGSLVQAALLVFVWVLDPSLLPLTVIGAMVYSVFLIGQRVLNEAAYIRIDHKLNELYHASPMSPESYFLGMSLGILIAYTPPLVVLFAILEFLRPMSLAATGMLVLVLLGIWAFSASLGYYISTLFKDMKTIWPYSSLLTNLFGIVPPVFFPLSVLTLRFPWAWVPALLVPTSSTTALVEAVAEMQPLSTTQYLVAGGSLAVEATLMLLFGIYWARRTAREA
jgi:ABC-2 type transport system permease protein